ncbi:hypothetical protein CGCTS75_v013527 [Colletotrichum tropicale]|nr:hypothetical protein CGCTS75_v013527 [Colletotrichum tropicale]
MVDVIPNVTLEAEYHGRGEHFYDYILDANYKTHASVWWGTRLSNIYYTGILTAISQIEKLTEVIPNVEMWEKPEGVYVNRARLAFTPSGLGKDIRSENFFNLDWSFNFDNSQILHWIQPEAQNVPKYNSPFWASPTLTESLHYAKIMYSLFALDLGNCESASLLVNDDGLNYAISDPQNMNRIPGGLLNNPDTFPAGSELDARAAGKWEAHAKYYALGGKVGREIYISGTWTDPIKNPGQPSGTCTARIGGISGGTPNVVGCNCEISATGPLKFESTCFLDFAEDASNGDWAAGFSVAFKCSAFFSCTGSNAYSIASANSACKNTSGTPCAGFHVTP